MSTTIMTIAAKRAVARNFNKMTHFIGDAIPAEYPHTLEIYSAAGDPKGWYTVPLPKAKEEPKMVPATMKVAYKRFEGCKLLKVGEPVEEGWNVIHKYNPKVYFIEEHLMPRVTDAVVRAGITNKDKSQLGKELYDAIEPFIRRGDNVVTEIHDIVPKTPTPLILDEETIKWIDSVEELPADQKLTPGRNYFAAVHVREFAEPEIKFFEAPKGFKGDFIYEKISRLTKETGKLWIGAAFWGFARNEDMMKELGQRWFHEKVLAKQVVDSIRKEVLQTIDSKLGMSEYWDSSHKMLQTITDGNGFTPGAKPDFHSFTLIQRLDYEDGNGQPSNEPSCRIADIIYAIQRAMSKHLLLQAPKNRGITSNASIESKQRKDELAELDKKEAELKERLKSSAYFDILGKAIDHFSPEPPAQEEEAAPEKVVDAIEFNQEFWSKSGYWLMVAARQETIRFAGYLFDMGYKRPKTFGSREAFIAHEVERITEGLPKYELVG